MRMILLASGVGASLLLSVFIVETVGYAIEPSGIEVYVAEKKDSAKTLCFYTVINKNGLFAINHFGLQGVKEKPLNWESDPKSGNLGPDLSPVGWSETLGRGRSNGKDARSFGWDAGDLNHAIFNGASKVFSIALPAESDSSCDVDSWEAGGEQHLTGKVRIGPASGQ